MIDQDYYPISNSGQSINDASKTNSDLMFGPAIYSNLPVTYPCIIAMGNRLHRLSGEFYLFETEDEDSPIDDDLIYNTIISLN
jgi:hypothetical protein